MKYINRARPAQSILISASIFCFGATYSIGQEVDVTDPLGIEVLTRGPVHEAFAELVAFDPEPGIVVKKLPPDSIEELPPEDRPEGNNVAWIPGYWGWDEDLDDFLWISGTWRALPPGRQWITGYWAETKAGHQWVSGYWADTAAEETVYLPPPPRTVEAGPNVVAPSVDHSWSPGSWVWYEERYAWRPGYWARGRQDWDWIPAHYTWTPRGYVFNDGYWDYPFQRRGLLYAPVYYRSAIYRRQGYQYSPGFVVNLSILSDHLFLRPSYRHYYYGDYYNPRYERSGYYASWSLSNGPRRHYYDPIYVHQHWVHRGDRGWANQRNAAYQLRRDNENARPPRTWSDQRNNNQIQVAVNVNQVTQINDNSVRIQRISMDERKKQAQRGREVQKSRDQRRTLETTGPGSGQKKPGETVKPIRLAQARSPIAANLVDQFPKELAPPKAQREPQPNPPGAKNPGPGKGKSQPSTNPGPGKSNPTKSNPGKGKSAPGTNPGPGKSNPGKGKSEPRTNPGPGKSNPGKGKSDLRTIPVPAKPNPAKSNPAKSNPAKSNPAKSNPSGAKNPGPGKGKSDTRKNPVPAKPNTPGAQNSGRGPGNPVPRINRVPSRPVPSGAQNPGRGAGKSSPSEKGASRKSDKENN